jgi:hypothetical protein
MVTVLLSVVCIVILYCTGRFINQNPKLKPKMFMPVPIELIVVSTIIAFLMILFMVILYMLTLYTGPKIIKLKLETRLKSHLVAISAN